jgi:pSer/pThr/pTyr-binding forkhead associated (FHA) protein
MRKPYAFQVVLRVVVTDKGGKERAFEFQKREVTLGRGEKSDVVLNDGTVSRYHARIVEKDGKHILVDLRSDNGVFVNKKRLRAPMVISDRDEIRIGAFSIRVIQDELGPNQKGRIACPKCGGKLAFKNLADYCPACNLAFS